MLSLGRCRFRRRAVSSCSSCRLSSAAGARPMPSAAPPPPPQPPRAPRSPPRAAPPVERSSGSVSATTRLVLPYAPRSRRLASKMWTIITGVLPFWSLCDLQLRRCADSGLKTDEMWMSTTVWNRNLLGDRNYTHYHRFPQISQCFTSPFHPRLYPTGTARMRSTVYATVVRSCVHVV